MQKWKLFLPVLILITLLSLSLSHSVSAREPPAPKISLTPTTIYVTPCSNFQIDMLITDIPDGFMMTAFDCGLQWDPVYMESVELYPHLPAGWTYQIDSRPEEGWLYFGASGTGGSEWTEDRVWFTFVFHCLGEGTTTLELISPELGTIWLTDGDPTFATYPDPFTAIVHQRTPNVGGRFIATNKLIILAPYLGFIGLIATVTTVAVIMKRRKN